MGAPPERADSQIRIEQTADPELFFESAAHARVWPGLDSGIFGDRQKNRMMGRHLVAHRSDEHFGHLPRLLPCAVGRRRVDIIVYGAFSRMLRGWRPAPLADSFPRILEQT